MEAWILECYPPKEIIGVHSKVNLWFQVKRNVGVSIASIYLTILFPLRASFPLLYSFKKEKKQHINSTVIEEFI